MTPNTRELNNWKDPRFLERWKVEHRKKKAESSWRSPLFTGLPVAATVDTELAGIVEHAGPYQPRLNETLSERARRIDSRDRHTGEKTNGYAIPTLLALEADGSWNISPVARRARKEKLEKAQHLYRKGLDRKAQRELACGLLGGEVVCRNGHAFCIGYECGNRYCVDCGPRAANRLFAKHHSRLTAVARRLVPEWPPAPGKKPRVVIAKLDFTLRNTGQMPTPKLMRRLNDCIKRFCRAIERRYGISRQQYGLAFCDELGGNNTNAHAHGVYVGPWLPQERKELSRLWAKITGDGSFIISIKYAKSFESALFHAVKYPAKLIHSSGPERLADLEIVFHRVRRFHALAAFYNPKSDAENVEPNQDCSSCRRCPECNEQLSEVTRWVPIAQLEARGLRDVRQAKAEFARARIFSG
jgi:hypothetical protein